MAKAKAKSKRPARKKTVARKTRRPERVLRNLVHYYEKGGRRYVPLGGLSTWDVVLWGPTGVEPTTLIIGCRRLTTYREARNRYAGGVRNGDQFQLRPHHPALVEYAKAICHTNGWKW